MPDLALELKDLLRQKVLNAKKVTKYRAPLLGFVAADDPGFREIKEVVTPNHLLPRDILPEAKTVLAFFVPFAIEPIRANRRSKEVAREWALAYVETNALIGELCQAIHDFLAPLGYKTGWQPATHNFNEETLESLWSHRSVAYLAGLGSFGVNRMLITPAGCAGRFGSVVTSAEIEPSGRISQEFCLFKSEGKCNFCVSNCLTGALTLSGIDKHKCYSHLLEVAKDFSDLGLCDVCGKCCVGPCAIK